MEGKVHSSVEPKKKVLSSEILHSSIPHSFIRPESKRPVIDLCSPGRPCIGHQVNLEAVKKMSEVSYEFFGLPVEEKMKLYSEDPSKTLRRSTSLNVIKEKVHNWRDYLRLHCYPLPQWPSNPPSSTPNWYALFAFQIPVIGAIVQMHFPNSSPVDEYPASIWIFIISLLFYCFAFGYYTKFPNYTPAIALISGSLANAALISLLVPHFLQPLVFIAWLMSLITYFNSNKIAKMGENMASKLCGQWRRTKRTNVPEISRPPV